MRIAMLVLVLVMSALVDDARADRGGGCNQYGCWRDGGGCNQYGCWNGRTGSCNQYGCSDHGGCNQYGCWKGRTGSCNQYGCSDHGGCNQYGCWKSPRGSCNQYGCSENGVCSQYGCPSDDGADRHRRRRPGRRAALDGETALHVFARSSDDERAACASHR